MVARWRARAGEAGKIESILRELAAAVRQEPGNLQFTVHRSHDHPDDLLLYEIYASADAFAAHQQTAHFKKLVLERAVPLLEVRDRRGYAVAEDI